MTPTPLTEAPCHLLKTDRLGRVRTDRVRREAILDEFERSGGSGAQFAALLGIKYQTFASWVQRRRRERDGESPAKNRKLPAPTRLWMEAVIDGLENPLPPLPQENSLRISLPGGAQVEMTRAGQAPLVAELLRHLTGKGQ